MFVNAFREQQTQLEQQQRQLDAQQKQVEDLRRLVCAQSPAAGVCKAAK